MLLACKILVIGSFTLFLVIDTIQSETALPIACSFPNVELLIG